MSAVVRHYSCVSVTADGKVERCFGSLDAPIGESTITGDHIIPPERFTVPTLDYLILWQQEHNKTRFTSMKFRIIGEGTLVVWSRYDLPTSASDYTALGTRKRWRNQNWPCKLDAWSLCEQGALSVSSLTDEVADDGGLPKLMTSLLGSAATVVADKVLVYNNTAASVVIERSLIQ